MEGTHSRAAWHSEVTPVHRNELHTVKNTEREAGSSKHKNKEMDILLSGLIDLHYVYVLKNLQVFQVKNKKQKNKIETKNVAKLWEYTQRLFSIHNFTNVCVIPCMYDFKISSPKSTSLEFCVFFFS